MRLQQAERKRAKIKMALQGCSGSGKTYSALLVAFGLCKNWNKIAVIDTENHSSNLYAHLGKYNVLNLSAPFTPEKYVEAIHVCEQSSMEVIIIDSSSHEWDGSGGILDIHGNMAGNSFTNWNKVTPRHNAFVNTILQSSCHLISTIRTKQDYVLMEKNNKQVPEKVGLKGIQRDGVDYEMTLVFDLDIKNNAVATKDRTGLFFGKPEQKLSIQTGEEISAWCNSGSEYSIDDISIRIGECKTLNELLALYKEFPQYKQGLHSEYETRKRQIVLNSQVQSELANHKNLSTNGTL